ncbi:MAG TPA: MBL fold metallo-hydrolase [Chloroflexota bacterium]|nr:MBL fold metallo-hydrolase [Chloroflexota bacterium]
MQTRSGLQAPGSRNWDDEVVAALRAAQNAAGFEHVGLLSGLGLMPLLGARASDPTNEPPAFVRDPSVVPAREVWYADSAQVFDNLYFVGGKIHSAWALKTSQGFILIDTIYPYNSEELIVGGLRRLGFDASDIKYVIVSHAHGDHIGGAEMLQNRGQRILMDPRDWDLVEQFPNRYLTMAPKRDLEAADGMQLTLGDTTVTIWRTPGHTAGTLSYTFTVFDNGRPVNVAYSGGTGFLAPSATPDLGIKHFQTYIDSQKHIAARAAETNATVILSNHSVHDNAVNRIRMLAGRGDGPHPFEVGADMVQRYFLVMQHCARAAQIMLERTA